MSAKKQICALCGRPRALHMCSAGLLSRAKVVAVLRRDAEKEDVLRKKNTLATAWHRERAFALRRQADIFEAGKEDE